MTKSNSISLTEKYTFVYEDWELVGSSRGEWLHRTALACNPKISRCRGKCYDILELKLKFKPVHGEKVGRVRATIELDECKKSVKGRAERGPKGYCFVDEIRIPHAVKNFTLHFDIKVKIENCHGDKKVFDVIVAGLGAAGSIAANGLSNQNYGNRSVLGLEWGPNANDDPLVTEPFTFNSQAGTINLLIAVDAAGIAQVVQSSPENGWGLNDRVQNRIGTMLGGSTGKNLLFAVHGSPEYQEDLAVNYTTGGWDDWKEVYEAIETYRGVSNDTNNDCRGDKGKIIVTQGGVPDNVVFGQKMAEVAGVELVDDFNDCVNTCVGKTTQQFLNFGKRSFGGTSYLGEDVMDQETGKGKGDWSKLLVKTGSPVRRVLFDCDKNAVGVEVVENEGAKISYYYATECVSICASSIYSPALLQRSGVGPQSVLDKIGARAVHVNENVGANYTDHYGGLIQIETSDEESSTGAVGFIDITKDGLNLGGTRRGVQYQFVDGLRVDAAYAASQNLVQEPGRRYFSLLAWNLRPQSRGHVNAVSMDPSDRVFFDFNGFSDPDGNDQAVARESVFFVKDVVDALNADLGDGTYKIVYPKAEDIDRANPEKIDPYVLGNPQITDHPCSTCQFNSNDVSSSVTDDRLNVLGVNKLKVADVSVFPVIPDGNTAFPGYFAGVKLIEFITGLKFGQDTPV